MESSYRNVPSWLLAVGGLTACAVYWAMTLGSSQPNIWEFLLLYVAAFGLCAAWSHAVWHPSPSQQRQFMVLIVGIAAVARLICVFGEPIFDDDLYRYLWDGRVGSSGINPFFYPPDSYFLEALRDGNWQAVGYKSVQTIYPPLAQALFRVTQEIGGGHALPLRLVLIAFDMGVIALIAVLLRDLDRPMTRVILYAWNPLVIKEFANSSHIEVVAIFFTLAMMVLLLRQRPLAGAACLGLGVLAKLVPVLLVPIVWKRIGWRGVAVVMSVVVVGYLPYVDAGEMLFSGLMTYGETWEYNGSVFSLLALVAEGVNGSMTGVRLLVGAAWVATALALGRAVQAGWSPVAAVACWLAVFLALHPSPQPWYGVWLIPFLCIWPWRAGWIWMLTIVLSYGYYIDASDRWWIRLCEYLPVYGVLVWQGARALGRRGDSPSCLHWPHFLTTPWRRWPVTTAALIVLASASAGSAGPWLPAKGQIQFHSQFIRTHSSQMRLADGSRQLFPAVDMSSYVAGLQVGVGDGWSLTASFPYQRTTGGGSESGLNVAGDAQARLERAIWQEMDGDRLSIALSGGLKWPLSDYPTDEMTSPGDHQLDVDMSLSIGRNGRWGGSTLYGMVETGARWRQGSPPNDVQAYGEIGISPRPRFTLRLFADAREALGGLGIKSPTFRARKETTGHRPFAAVGEDVVGVGTGLSLRLTRDIVLDLFFSRPLRVRNSSFERHTGLGLIWTM